MHIVNLHNSYHASNVPSSSKSSYVSALTTDNTPLALNKTARPHYLVGLVTIGVLSALGGSGFQAAAIQQTVEALEQCAFSAGLVATAQTHLVYRGLVMAGLMYHLVLSIDTARLHNAAHTTALILNSFLRTVFQGIQIYQNQHWLQWTAELNCTGPASSIILDYASLALVTLFFLLEIFYCCWWRRQAFSWATDKSESTGATPVVAATSVISLMKLNVYYLFEFSAQLAPMTALHYPLMNIYEAIVVPISGALIAIVAWYVLTSETAPDRSDGGVPCGFALTSTTIERRRRAWLIGIVGLYCLSVAYFSYRVVLLASPVPLPWNDSYRITRQALLFGALTLSALHLLTSGVLTILIRRMTHLQQQEQTSIAQRVDVLSSATNSLVGFPSFFSLLITHISGGGGGGVSKAAEAG